MGLHRSEANLEVAKRENSVILLEDNYVEKYDGFDPNAPEAHIIFSLFQYAFINQSVSFASKIEQQMETTANRKSRGVKQAGFLVLYKTTMPGVLIELGFISNKNDEAFLTSAAGQDATAHGLLNAFANYKKEIQGDKETFNIQPEKNTPAPVVIEKKDTVKPAETKTTVTTTKAPEKVVPVEVKETQPIVSEKTIPEKTVVKPVNTDTLPPAGEKIPDDNTIAPNYIFKVQFAASKVKLPADEPRLKKVLEYEIEKADNGYLRYLSGKFISLKTAESQRDILKQIGFPDAFIVPYENGTKRITLKEYLEKQ